MRGLAEEVIFVRKATGLVREVGPFTAMSIVLCHVIGGGINFYSVKASVTAPGANIHLAFIIAGIPTLCLGLAFALMGIMMPRTGGDYIFVTRVLDPTVGFLTSWMFWFTEAISFGVIAYLDVAFWGLGVWIVGLAFGDQGLMDIGNWLMKAWDVGSVAGLAIGALLVIIWWIIGLVGLRVYAAIMNIVLIIPAIGSLITLGLFGSAMLNPDLPVKMWESRFGTGSVEKVFQLAEELGWDPNKYAYGASWPGTMAASIAATWAFIGFTATAFVGSEVKHPTRSMLVGMFVGTLMIAVYYVALTFMMYGAWNINGKNFISAYAFAFTENSSKLSAEALGGKPAPMPCLPLFAAILTDNFAIAFYVAITAAFWLMNDIPAFLLVCSRTVFAWSFDRFFPEIFAAVNERFHTPHWAVSISSIIGIIGVTGCYLPMLGPWFMMVGTTVFCIFRYLFDCLTGIMVPFKRPEIYERGLKIEIAGIPLISIVSWIALVFWSYIFWWACLELDPMTINTYTVWIAIGMLIFSGYYVYNRKRGIDVASIYREVPPA